MYRHAFHQVTISLALWFLLARASAISLNDTIITQREHTISRNEDWHRRTSIVLQCRDFPGLSKEQQSTCLRYPHEVAAALLGLRLSIAECQYQFRWHRWNCSSLRSSKNRNPHSSPLLNRGYRESAFAFAISAAGVMHSVSRACSQGRLPNCGCGLEIENQLEQPLDQGDHQLQVHVTEENHIRKRRGWNHGVPKGQWQWGGCSHNLQFGAKFSALFLDSREMHGEDLQAHVNLHNNRAGRLAVLTQTQLRCKCHGLSGSCEVRTCWHAPPEFRRVGDALKSHFRAAVLVNQGNLGRPRDEDIDSDNRLDESERQSIRQPEIQRRHEQYQKRRKREPLAHDLLYFQRSPSFCEDSADFPGTTGRKCHKNSLGMDGCSSLCCGRGYNVLRQRRLERCLCRFHWCCQVICKNCTIEEWVTVCK